MLFTQPFFFKVVGHFFFFFWSFMECCKSRCLEENVYAWNQITILLNVKLFYHKNTYYSVFKTKKLYFKNVQLSIIKVFECTRSNTFTQILYYAVEKPSRCEQKRRGWITEFQFNSVYFFDPLSVHYFLIIFRKTIVIHTKAFDRNSTNEQYYY